MAAVARGGDVAAAELDGVHDERGDLVERDASSQPSASGKPRRRRRSSRRRSRRRAASSPGRTRGARRARPGPSASWPPSSDQSVASPEVAVQPGRRLGWRTGVETAGERFKLLDRVGRGGRRRQPPARQGQEPVGRVELGPGLARLVGQAAAARGAPVLPAEARGAGAVQLGERRPRSSSVDGPAGPRSIHSRARNAGADVGGRPAPAARRRPTHRASQARPVASVVKNPGGAGGWVFTKTRRPSSRSTANAIETSPPCTRDEETTALSSACSTTRESSTSKAHHPRNTRSNIQARRVVSGHGLVTGGSCVRGRS